MNCHCVFTFIILISTLNWSLAQSSSIASWELQNSETKAENATVLTPEASLGELMAAIEMLKTKSKQGRIIKEIHSDLSGTTMNIAKLSADYMGWNFTEITAAKACASNKLAKRTGNLCDLSQSFEAFSALLDSIEPNNTSSRGVTAILSMRDSQKYQDLAMMKLFEGKAERKWKLETVLYVDELNVKDQVKILALAMRSVFYVDLDGNTALILLAEAYRYGLRRRIMENIWLLSATTTREFPITSGVPDTIIVGFRVIPGNETANKSVVDDWCKKAISRPINVQVLQLLNIPRYGGSKSWQTIGSWSRNYFNAKIVTQPISAMPKLRIVTGDSYAPYVQITARGRNWDCGLNGMLGYRYENTTSKRTIGICAFGRDIDFIRFFEKDLGFQTELYVAQDGTWGKTGALGDIMAGKADFLVSSYVTQHAEYSSFHMQGISVAYIQKDVDTAAFSLTGPFKLDVWLVLAGTFVVAVLALWVLEMISPYSNFQRNRRAGSQKELGSFCPDDSLNYSVGLMVCGELINKKPKSSSARVLAIAVSFFALALIASYTGNIITYLVVTNTVPPITGIYDPKLLSKKVAALRGSVPAEVFRTSNNEQIRRLWDGVIYVRNFHEGMEKLMVGKIDFFIADKFSLNYFSAKNKSCRIKNVPVRMPLFGIGIAFRKGLGWKHQISTALSKMMLDGAYDQIHGEYNAQQTTCTAQPQSGSLGLSHFTSLFVCIGVGIAISLIVAFLVSIFRRLQARYYRSEQIALSNDTRL